MNRLAFITRILALTGFGLPLLQKPEQKRETFRLYEGHIAGYQYYDWEELEDLLNEGQRLQLRREPDNEYDHRAIEVLLGEHKLGYIPRGENRVLADLMDQGMELRAWISAYRPNAYAWHRINVDVRM